MENYQKQVLIEETELNEKIVKLTQFLYSDNSMVLSEKKWGIMLRQLEGMADYSKWLRIRIARFKSDRCEERQ